MDEDNQDVKSMPEPTLDDIETIMAENDKADSGLDVWEIRSLLVQRGFPKQALNVTKLRRILTHGIGEDRLAKKESNESLNSKEKDYTPKTARKTRARNESLRPMKRKRGISTGKVTKTKRSQNNDKSKPKSNNLNKHQKNEEQQHKLSCNLKRAKKNQIDGPVSIIQNNKSSHVKPHKINPNSETEYVKFTTKGDGRCLFRSIAVCLRPDLQVERKNGIIEDPKLMLQETCLADNLRTQVVLYGLDHYDRLSQELTGDILKADMPSGYNFDSFLERLKYVSDVTSQAGEIELSILSDVINRRIDVIDKASGNITSYGEKFSEMPPIYVLYESLEESSGHYLALKKL